MKASEELLQTQQEELQQTNEELEERSQLLGEQNARIEVKNREVESARVALEEQAEQLALSSKYKSEFLANMSHELRTPLNSLLILAKLLSENPEENLTEKQTEFASTIYSAGSDLLDLINDILDLSKVEAGKMDLNPREVKLADLRDFVERSFGVVAGEKGLELGVEIVGANVPPTIYTDEQRLQQILKNLLSNAVKFTGSGSVKLHIGLVDGVRFQTKTLRDADAVLGFSVQDTGIGIAVDKLKLIFEAFQQADGTTSRKYGGTGLGLSISREIARLLGGEIHVTSRTGEGSTFTLYLPAAYDAAVKAPTPDEPAVTAAAPEPFQPELDPSLLLPSEVADDRDEIDEGDRVVLIVEDDPDFARTVLGIARERGFKGVVGLRAQNALRAGAMAFLEKPVSKQTLDEAFGQITTFIDRGVRRLLVVEDDETQRNAIVELIGTGDDVEITAVGSSEEALEALESTQIDCMVLDLKLPKMTGFTLLETVKTDQQFDSLPIIIYTGKELTRKDETRLKKYAQTIIVKDVSSPERLLDETALFLHRVETHLPSEKRRMLEQLHSTDEVFRGKKVLIVDDDVRNVFALASVLEANGMEVVYAENGREGIDVLQANQDVDLVLMDVMMPELDGYETTREIRRLDSFGELPIISLTAKAMKGDHEKSIASGASDYITKPVDTDQLLSLMRVWLYR